MLVVALPYYYSEEINGNEKDTACGMHAGFWLENLKKKGHLEDLGTGRRIILKCILKKKGGAGRLDSSGSE
jgi:hypothetical protein